MQPADTEQLMGHKSPLIRSTGLVSRQSPTAHKFLVAEQTEDCIGVTNIYDEKHKDPRRGARGVNRKSSKEANHIVRILASEQV